MGSIQERLQEARETGERSYPVSLPLPGYKGDELVIRYKGVDWDASRSYIKSQIEDAPSSVELEAIADGLLVASIGSEAHIDGETHELAHKLGTNLAEFLGLDVTVDGRRVHDREAVFLLVPDDLDLVTHWNELVAESRQSKDKVDETVVGESQAS